MMHLVAVQLMHPDVLVQTPHRPLTIVEFPGHYAFSI